MANIPYLSPLNLQSSRSGILGHTILYVYQVLRYIHVCISLHFIRFLDLFRVGWVVKVLVCRIVEFVYGSGACIVTHVVSDVMQQWL